MGLPQALRSPEELDTLKRQVKVIESLLLT